MTEDAKVKLKRKIYDKELSKLQVELCYLQDWVKATDERIIIVLEGRDAAGSASARACSASCLCRPHRPRKDLDVHTALH